jgi:release factor glutamine methyltransferase
MKSTLEEEILLSEILKKPKEFLLTHPIFKLNTTQQKRFQKMRSDLAKGLPLAYILGHKWFYSLKFVVNKYVLIPRPETEQLVEKALELIKKDGLTTVVDVGTGPGTIILTIAANLPKSKVKFYGIDVSSKALAVARLNQKIIIKKSLVEFNKGDLLSSFKIKPGHQNVLITANLPYLSSKELKEPSIKHEPKLALYGGAKSHALIEKLVQQISALNLKNSAVLLEINFDQATKLQSIIKKQLPNADVKIYKDLSKFDRIIEIYLA